MINKAALLYLQYIFTQIWNNMRAYIEDGEEVVEAEVGDDDEDDSIEIHDVVLVVIIICFQVNQPKHQGKELKHNSKRVN